MQSMKTLKDGLETNVQWHTINETVNEYHSILIYVTPLLKKNHMFS
jgi:hypothetical protein